VSGQLSRFTPDTRNLKPETLVPMSNFHAIPRQLGCHGHFSKLNDEVCITGTSGLIQAVCQMRRSPEFNPNFAKAEGFQSQASRVKSTDGLVPFLNQNYNPLKI
jgi:hypothetical protein